MSYSTHPSHPPLSPSRTQMGSIDALHAPTSGLEDPVELILLGTGTSSTLPHVDCLTAPPGAKPCKTCLSTLTPEGRKNKRVSALWPISPLRSVRPDAGSISYPAQHICRAQSPRLRRKAQVSTAPVPVPLRDSEWKSPRADCCRFALSFRAGLS